MAEQTADVEMIDLDESDSVGDKEKVHSDKENGFCDESTSDDVAVKAKIPSLIESDTKDTTLNNSNHDDDDILGISRDEDTVDDDASPSGPQTMAVDEEEEEPEKANGKESEESKETDSQSPKNDIESESVANSNDDDDVEGKVEDTATSPLSSAKDSEATEEESSSKPSAIPDRLLDDAPRNSPELIVADDGIVEENVSSDAAKPAVEESKVEEDDTKEDTTTEVCANESLNEKEPESKKAENGPGGKKERESGKRKKGKTCAECGVKKKLHFRIGFQGKVHQLCSETCLKEFKSKQARPSPTPPPAPDVDQKCAQCQKEIKSGQGYYPLIGEVKALCSEDCLKKYHEANISPRNCSHCKSPIESHYNQLTWETMAFCNDQCLGKYQAFLGSHCTCCQTPVQQASLGKYCVCFGADIRQFCSGSCLEDFKKGLKVCSFCQTDLSAGGEGFLAPVGDKGQFKDFCSQQCMERYEAMNNISKTIPEVHECAHCKKQGSFKTHVKLDDKVYSLCCDNCVSGFRCSMRITDNMCDTCYKFFKNPKTDDGFSIIYDHTVKHFCTKPCMTLFVLSHRKIVQCIQCKVKKYTFDMIERLDSNNQTQVFCSLNCLSLFRVNVSAISAKNVRCDNCTNNSPAQYHLTMSDGSIRNFCTYQCVLVFQNQFTTVPALTTTAVTRQTASIKTGGMKTTTSINSPVIANVVSLAQQPRPLLPVQGKGLVPQTLVSVRPQGPSLSVLSPKTQLPSPIATATLSVAPPLPGAGVREIVVRPPVPKSVRNKSASCKPIMQTKGINVKLQTCHKAVQTDERPMPLILPVPIPVYVPTPMHMFSRPVPCPVPFPVPIPVPILIPSKDYKGIKDSMRPYEPDLIQIPEIVTEDTEKSEKETSEEKEKEATSCPVDQTNASAVNNVESRVDMKAEHDDEHPPRENRMKHRNKRALEMKYKESKKAKFDEDVNNVEADGDKPIEVMKINFEDTDTKLKVS